jgi:hypothetical protein
MSFLMYCPQWPYHTASAGDTNSTKYSHFQILIVAQLVQEIGVFLFTRNRHWTLQRPSWTESTSCFIHFNITLLSTPRSPKWSLLGVFRIKFCTVFLSPHVQPILDLIIILWRRAHYEAPHYAFFLHLPFTSSILNPNLLLSTLFSKAIAFSP